MRSPASHPTAVSFCFYPCHNKSAMTENEMEAIAGGFHGDPFRMLGPHRVSEEALDQWEVRAFLPNAAKVSVVSSNGTYAMERLHPHGFFIVKLTSAPGNYRLRLENYQGGIQEIEDPYRFPTLLTDFDLHLFGEGTHYEAYRTLGAHLQVVDGIPGTRFAVWAPNALVVSVVGDFNGWDSRIHPMRARTGGIWELFLPNIGVGTSYKYAVKSRFHGYFQMKSDPYGFAMEEPPKSASIVADIHDYEWRDQNWLQRRATTNWLESPFTIYELHAGSWQKNEDGSPMSYRDLAHKLVPYVKELGFTHIELMPPMEHPFAGSWGYQVIGYFAPTARFGTPQDFMYFVDQCHQAGVGVIVDWVPGHFPKDAHGLAYFDGTALYEHADPRLGEHKDWGTLIFNYGRNEVKNFLISNALFWVKHYHIDGLRVDAVASMLYLDYSRKAGEWVPNIHGGNENLEAIDILRKMNELVHQVPGVITAAEESTSFPGVSRPVYLNGLGFTFKWNMGWMHDMLNYFSLDPIYRKYHQGEITFSMVYAFSENFILPISHDEVVYGKKALLDKMPGDEWQRFANARAFLSYMWAHPGKKLLFMGAEFGQTAEWNSNDQAQWWLLQFDVHRKLQAFTKYLNELCQREPALYEVDFHWEGFEWIDFHDMQNSMIAFIRKAKNPKDYIVFVCNFTPQPHPAYRLGLPEAGEYREILNSDSEFFGGSNMGNGGRVFSEPIPSHGREASAELVIPPLAVIALKPVRHGS
jgi:1,4-alpha-glucan branching enzyme